METKHLATSLFKALDVLSLLSSNPEGLLIGAIVEEMELPRSSLIRMLDSLAHYGLVDRDAHRRYYVTMKFRDWKRADEDEQLITKYRPLMKRITTEIGEMAVLGRLKGRRIQHLHYEEPDCRVRVMPPIGRKFTTHKMAMGKLALSQRSDLIPNDCPEEIKEEIELALKNGYAWNRGESEGGITAWGTWLGEPSPLTPMLAITWPEFRFTEESLRKVESILADAV